MSVLDDLAEGQGDDGEVVAAQPEHRHAHDDARDGGKRRADDDGDYEAQLRRGHGALQAHGGDDAGKRADAHEARVAER